MNEKTINEQYAYIYSLLEDRRLKEALIQLESLLWQCSDWDLRTRLEQLQTSYKYMLDYMRQGANDPERWNLYQKMLTDTWAIADQSRLLMLDNASSNYYHKYCIYWSLSMTTWQSADYSLTQKWMKS